ncbi:MAG: hypothetical protein ACI4K9_06675 [Candidatus Fimenecus sp.]
MGLSLAVCFGAVTLLFLIAAYPLQLYKITYNPQNRAQRILLCAAVALCLLPTIYIFCSMPHENIVYPFTGLLENQNGYEQQFDAFLKGQLYLDFAPDERILALENPYDPAARAETGAWYPWDRALFQGKYYSYFGIAPLLTVYFPYYALTGALPAPQTVCFLLAAVGVIAVALLVLRLVRLFVPDCNFCALVLSIFAAVSGSLLYMVQSSADMYYIAVQSGITHLVLFLLFAFCAYKQPKTGKSVVFLILSALNLVLTVLSRPNLAVYALLVVPIFLCIFFGKDGTRLQNFIKLFSFAVPTLLGAAGVMWYNYARFGSVLEFGATYQLTVCDVSQYRFLGTLFLPALYHYFLQFPQLENTFPYIKLTFEVYPNKAAYLYATRMLGAFSMPSLASLVLCPATYRKYKSFVQPITFTLAAISCLLLAYFDTCFAGVCVRYLADIATVAAVFSGLILLDLQARFFKNKTGVQYTIFIAVCVLFLLTTAVGVLLMFENERNFLFAQ